MEALSPSTINVRLSAVRKLVGEARRAGMIGQEEAASLASLHQTLKIVRLAFGAKTCRL
jgi:hypothetical protein